MLQTSVHRQIRHLAIWLGLWALLFQTLAPTFIYPHIRGSLSSLHICSVQELSKSGSTSNKSHPSQLPLCPLCQMMHQLGGFIPPFEVSFLIKVEQNLLFSFAISTALNQHIFSPNAQPRAPPGFL